MIIKRKLFTKYDETDRLKQMKDSDILAEKKKKKGAKIGRLIRATAGGVVTGGLTGGLVGGTRGIFVPGKGTIASGAGKLSALGAIGGGLIAGLAESRKIAEENRDIDFYNDRLEYAKGQARRRESKDWKQNMTYREGYTY